MDIEKYEYEWGMLMKGNVIYSFLYVDSQSVDSVISYLPSYSLYDSTTNRYIAEILIKMLKPGAYALLQSKAKETHRWVCIFEDAGFTIRSKLYDKKFNGKEIVVEEWLMLQKPVEQGLTIAGNVLKWGTGAINIDACRIGTYEGKTKCKKGQTSSYGLFSGKAGEIQYLGRWPAHLVHDGSPEVIASFPNTHSTATPNCNGKTYENDPDGINTFMTGKTTLSKIDNDDKGGSAARFFYGYGYESPENKKNFNKKKWFKTINGCVTTCGSTPETSPESWTWDEAKQDYYTITPGYGDDAEGASRFFFNYMNDNLIDEDEWISLSLYHAKIRPQDKNEGLDDFETKQITGGGGTKSLELGGKLGSIKAMEKNTHVTVKPNTLMRYLVKLITPPNGTVLDMFNGSGSTGKAAVQEGFRYVGVERSEEYVEISKYRIQYAYDKVHEDDVTVVETITETDNKSIVDTNKQTKQNNIPTLF